MIDSSNTEISVVTISISAKLTRIWRKTPHTGLEALSSKKKVSVHGTGVPVFLRPVW